MEGAACVAEEGDEASSSSSKFAVRRGMASRRRLLASSLAGGFALLASPPVRAETSTGSRGSGFTRFVHLTDIHLWGRHTAIAGFEAAMESIAALDPAPDFLISGGDHIMDGFGVDRSAARLLWDLYDQNLARHCQ